MQCSTMHRRLYTTNRYKAQCFPVFPPNKRDINNCFIVLTVCPLYLSQARSIQELGRKKFEKLRIGFERSQIELKSEQKAGSNYLVKKQPKKPLAHASQEPVGSDFSSGATLATIADVQPTSHLMQSGRCERTGNIGGILEANAFWIDANQEKAEDVLSGMSVMRTSYYLSPLLHLPSLFL